MYDKIHYKKKKKEIKKKQNEVIKDSGVSLFLFLRPLALGGSQLACWEDTQADQWRDRRGKVLRVVSPALVKPLEDAVLENILIETS